MSNSEERKGTDFICVFLLLILSTFSLIKTEGEGERETALLVK